MEKQQQTTVNHMNALAEDARALIAATADVAEASVSEARQRLAAALQSGKEIYGHVREQAVEGAEAANVTVREHPYQAIGIAFGLGAVIGFVVACRCSGNSN